MRKKATILATAIIIIIVVVFFEFYVFRLPMQQTETQQTETQQTTTVSVINSDPSAWVNKPIVVEGNLVGPLILEADEPLPYDYELNSSGQTIGLTFSPSLNLTSTTRFYLLNSSITLRIYGTVTKGFQYDLFWLPLVKIGFGRWGSAEWVVYYIVAEKVETV